MKKNTTSKKQATKKATPKKSNVDPKRIAKAEAILEKIGEQVEEEGEGGGKIHCILTLYIKGFTRKEIVEVGFNKSTVYRQTKEYENLRKAPATHYQGFPIFEARLQRVMQAKKMTREAAMDWINQQDIKALEEEK